MDNWVALSDGTVAQILPAGDLGLTDGRSMALVAAAEEGLVGWDVLLEYVRLAVPAERARVEEILDGEPDSDALADLRDQLIRLGGQLAEVTGMLGARIEVMPPTLVVPLLKAAQVLASLAADVTDRARPERVASIWDAMPAVPASGFLAELFAPVE